jgi:hypothetical protein
MKRVFSIAVLIALCLISTTITFGQVTPSNPPVDDRDGDDVLDVLDRCPNIAGSENVIGLRESPRTGCPDQDGDRLIDAQDQCPSIYSDEVNGAHQYPSGCPSRDLDGDGIGNGYGGDSCPFQAGTFETQGCPAIDSDDDGLLDAYDSCPTEAGLTANNGCPEIDSDGDTVIDAFDECPLQAGSVIAFGCYDSDGDGVYDEIDMCRLAVGSLYTSGCPDADNDGYADSIDLCSTIYGIECSEIEPTLQLIATPPVTTQPLTENIASPPLTASLVPSPPASTSVAYSYQSIPLSGIQLGSGHARLHYLHELNYQQSSSVRLEIVFDVYLVTPLALPSALQNSTATPQFENTNDQFRIFETMGASLSCVATSFTGCDEEVIIDEVRFISTNPEGWTWRIDPQDSVNGLQDLEIRVWSIEQINDGPRRDKTEWSHIFQINVRGKEEFSLSIFIQQNCGVILVAFLGVIGTIAKALIDRGNQPNAKLDKSN